MLLVCTGVLVSCAQEAPEPQVSQAQTVQPPEGEADQTYSTRGEVASLVEAGSPASEFRIRHEAIDHFVDMHGEVVGMSSHAMTFPYVAPGVEVDGLQVGDKVGFTFEVRWDADPRWIITELGVLDAGTALDFRKAQPAQDEAKNESRGAN